MKRKELYQLTLVHFREFFREPGILFWTLAFPILMAGVLGIAFTQKGELEQRVAWVKMDTKEIADKNFASFLKSATQLSHEKGKDEWVKLVKNEKLGNIKFRIIASSWNEALLMLKRGKVNIIIKEEQGTLTYHFDPKNPEAQLLYLQLSSAINNKAIIQSTSNIVELKKVGTRYIDFLIPGLIALGIMNSCMWGICYSLIDMRSKKLLRRMIATPMKKSNFLLSIFIARLILSIFEIMILVVFAHYFFKITIEGSFIAFLGLIFSGNVAFTGVSILVSSRTANSRIGTGLINVVTLPMMVLSGIFFSYHNFPEWSVTIIQKLPLTLLADSVRSIFIEGATLYNSVLPMGILCGVGIVFFVVGLRVYKWH